MTDRPTMLRIVLAELAEDPEALEALREMIGAAEAERMLKTSEAADRLGIHPKTLTNAASAGRVRGAYRVGKHAWRYRASELELLPPDPPAAGTVGAGRPKSRRPGPSSATESIRGTTRRAA